MEENINTEKITENQKPKRDGVKIAGLVFFILTCLFFAVSLFFAFAVDYDGDLGQALSVIILILVCGLFSFYPAVICGIVSAVLNGLRIKRYKSALTFFVISLIFTIAITVYFTAIIIVTIYFI